MRGTREDNGEKCMKMSYSTSLLSLLKINCARACVRACMYHRPEITYLNLGRGAVVMAYHLRTLAAIPRT